LDIMGFYSILNLIFECNIFTANDSYYIQKVGLPMGCICGPSVANLYLFLIEKNWLVIHSPILYGRFIDDICYINKGELNIEEFQTHFDYLKLNVASEKAINFLDLKISHNEIQDAIHFDLYTKPTNTFSYLLNTSNHPSHIFANIPKSLFIRIRRICTSYIDYLYHARNLSIKLIKRGYKKELVFGMCREIAKTDRADLLEY
jgi:hypothetical protein